MQSIVFSFLLLIPLVSFSQDQKYKLEWSDDFSGTEIDESKWSFQVGDGCPNLCGFGNNELQYYSSNSANARIENGRLIIEAKKESIGKRAYSSAKLMTKDKADWKHGKIEIMAKLPSGVGTWPAFWMLPTVEGRKMVWPEDGEIDIMEHVGFNQGMIYGTIHTKKYNHMIGTHKTDSLFIEGAESGFHLYGLEWTADELIWFVDGQEYNRIKRGNDDATGWPFNEHKYHLILNLAVGGNWGGKKGIDDRIWPQRIAIDYVKYYRLIQ